MSENRSPDIVEAALSTGGLGYLLKSDAGSDLLRAVNAVLELRHFVSASVVVHDSAYTTSQEPDNHPQHQNSRHEVAFYSDDAEFVDGFARFIERALKAGSAAIVILTESHHASLLQRLSTDGLEVAEAIEEGSYIRLNVADMLSKFMVDDSLDPVLFMQLARNLITEATIGADGKHRHIAVCGEGVHCLLSAGNLDATIKLERMWNEIAKHEELDILCGYFRDTFDKEEKVSMRERVCAEHSSVHGR